MSSAGPLGVPLHPAPLISSATHILGPLRFPSLSPLPSFHHHLGAPSPISPLSGLILSCNWTGVPGGGRQHAPVPRAPSPEWKRGRPIGR